MVSFAGEGGTSVPICTNTGSSLKTGSTPPPPLPLTGEMVPGGPVIGEGGVCGFSVSRCVPGELSEPGEPPPDEGDAAESNTHRRSVMDRGRDPFLRKRKRTRMSGLRPRIHSPTLHRLCVAFVSPHKIFSHLSTVRTTGVDSGPMNMLATSCSDLPIVSTPPTARIASPGLI